MLYEISAAKGSELTVYICREPSEISEAIFNCGKSLGIPQPLLGLSAFAVGPHMAGGNPEPLDFMGIKCRNLSEEENEKWQRAF